MTLETQVVNRDNLDVIRELRIIFQSNQRLILEYIPGYSIRNARPECNLQTTQQSPKQKKPIPNPLKARMLLIIRPLDHSTCDESANLE